MKKLFALCLVLVMALGLAGCSGSADEKIGDALPDDMVMVDGNIYHNTRHPFPYSTEDAAPEHWDGEITAQVGEDEVPTENDQSNFATSIGYRYSTQEGVIIVVDKYKKCWVYATEEAMETVDFDEPVKVKDPWGITMTAKNVTPVSLTLVVEQDGTELPDEPGFGSMYALETKKGDVWEELSYIVEGEVAWTLEIYNISTGNTREHPVVWRNLYGKLSAGQYRIAKTVLMSQEIGDTERRTYHAEFIIDKPVYEKVATLGKIEGVDTSVLVKFDGAVYAESLAVIDYDGQRTIWEGVRLATDGGNIPYWHCETNNEEWLDAQICECSGESLILREPDNSAYRLFTKVK